MNRKNVSLAAVAVVIAVGSAFASMFTAEDVWVRAKLRTDPSGSTECVNTNVQCDATGSSTCSVSVPVVGGTQTASTSGTFKPYRATCVQVLSNTSSTSLSSTVNTIDHLVQ